MKAYLLNETGGVENLKLTEIDQPKPGDNEVLVQVKAIGINPVDYKVRSIPGLVPMIMATDEMPVILGWDIAGTVTSVGSSDAGASKFQPGDAVFGMVRFPGHGRAYAEYVAAPEDQLALVPKGMSMEEAGATTLAALTALQALQSRVTAGDRVLIHAGSGGVGHYAIQIAKSLGCGEVIATSSAKNKDFCLSLGADRHIDYRAEKFDEALSDLDFVLDGMGGETLDRSLTIMKMSGGTIVTLPMAPTESEAAKAKEHNVQLEQIMVQSNGDDMKTLAEMVESGKLKAHVSKTFPFAELAEAHKQLESGRTVGRVVVTI